MDISIVIPLYNEAESLIELHHRIKKVVLSRDWSYDIWFIDDGSTDNSWTILKEIAKENSEVNAIKFRRNLGKTEALKAAFARVKGKVIITMDADLQDQPEEIPKLYNSIQKDDLDLVSGWKQKRKDPKLTKNLPSILFNSVAKLTSGVNIHDFNCGLKAMKKEVALSLELYGDMHRYIPVLAKNNGFEKITEVKIEHKARKYGTSKFGSDRFIKGFLDLITLWFSSKFMRRPMHFFGAIGTVLFLFGFLFSVFLGIEKLHDVYQSIPAKLITQTPFFYISLTCMLLGNQMFLAGFITEFLIRSLNKKHAEEIEKQIVEKK